MKCIKFLALVLSVTLLAGLFPASAARTERVIALSDSGVTLDGKTVTDAGAVTVSHDMIYYEDKDSYDSGNPYGEGTDEDKHTAAEAEAHTVVTIREPGVYRVSGQLSQGQLAIDLGEDAKRDPNAVVTLILDGVDITCTVAPAVIFYSVYECDTAWVAYDEEETADYTPTRDHDLSAAGAKVVLADGSVNHVHGAYVAKIYKDNDQQKKKYKFDGAFYSKMSMTVDGEETGDGVLNIVAEKEGLDSELHLELMGGKVNISSQDDGINTNEDGVSATTISGGSLHIVAGLGSEGDGIDSNGYLTISGGVVISIANPAADSGLDSDLGSVINGGTVVATGSTMDWPETQSGQVTINLQFAAAQASDEAVIVTDQDRKVVFAYDPDQDETTGAHSRGYQGAVISCPAFREGETYQVYVGGGVTGTDVDGLYDASTVTGMEGAVRQQYTGTDVRGGFRGGMGRPEGFPEGAPEGFPEGTERPQRGERPDGETPPELPDGETVPQPPAMPENGGTPPQLPDGEAMEEPPEKPDGEAPTPPDGETVPQPPDGEGEWRLDRDDFAASESDPSVDFYMQDKVNFFSGLADEQMAYSSQSTVEVDGKAVSFQMYALKDEKGNETNYVKVRDLADALNGTAAQFNVTWTGAVALTRGEEYVPNGTEHQTPFSGDRFYESADASTTVDGQEVDLHALLLTDDAGGGYTYYQLRDLGKALGFNVGWTAQRGVFVETDKPYSE